jgi:hypothetical protein
VKAIRALFKELFNNVNDIPMSLRIICRYLYEFTKHKIEYGSDPYRIVGKLIFNKWLNEVIMHPPEKKLSYRIEKEQVWIMNKA